MPAETMQNKKRRRVVLSDNAQIAARPLMAPMAQMAAEPDPGLQLGDEDEDIEGLEPAGGPFPGFEEEALAESQAQNARQMEPSPREAPQMAAPVEGGSEGGYLKGPAVLNSLADLDTYAGNLDFTPHAQLGAFGIKVPERKPYKSGLADTIQPHEQKILQDVFGVNVPLGARFSRIEKVLPEIAHVLRSRQVGSGAGLTPYQAAQLSARGQEHKDLQDFRNRSLGTRQSGQERMEKIANRIPSEDRENLSGLEYAETNIKKVLSDAKAAKFGPIQGRAQDFLRYLGLADTDTMKTRAQLAEGINTFIYRSTGKQLNEYEMQRLEKQLPQVWDSPEAFQAIGATFLDAIRGRKDSILNGLERESYDVSNWRNSPGQNPQGEGNEIETPRPGNEATPQTVARAKEVPPPPRGEALPPGMIRVLVPGPNGQMAEKMIHESWWSEVKRRYPNALRDDDNG